MKENCLLTLICLLILFTSLTMTLIIFTENTEYYKNEDDKYYQQNPIEAKITNKGFCKCNK